MILIECFSESLSENIMESLRLRPDKVYLLGDGSQMRKPLERCQTILQERGMKTKIKAVDTRGKDMGTIAGILADIIRREDACVIDLSGGDEVTILAVGALAASMDSELRSRVYIQRFDPQLGREVDCDGSGQVLRGRDTVLTVREQIYLYGGKVHPESYQPDAKCSPRDLDPLWTIVAEEPREWNKNLSALNEFEKYSPDKTDIRLDWDTLPEKIHNNYPGKKARVLALLEKFRQHGVIKNFRSTPNLQYSYDSPLLRYCTQKAGNVLEVKSLLEARALKDGGAPFFQDCQTGVHIDWDGVPHKPEERVPETRNEMDLILVRGSTPLFISCKNGNIGEDELYKLNTVATRFGGPQARKMLIAADLDQKDETSDQSYIQRAQDMGVYLVTDAAKLTKSEWRQIFSAAMQMKSF